MHPKNPKVRKLFGMQSVKSLQLTECCVVAAACTVEGIQTVEVDSR
jgi:hypothetical protein